MPVALNPWDGENDCDLLNSKVLLNFPVSVNCFEFVNFNDSVNCIEFENAADVENLLDWVKSEDFEKSKCEFVNFND